VALQAGEAKTLALWRALVTESQKHFREVYERLGVLLNENDTYGESFYIMTAWPPRWRTDAPGVDGDGPKGLFVLFRRVLPIAKVVRCP